MKMKKTVEDFLGEKISEAVITVPAYFDDAQRQGDERLGYCLRGPVQDGVLHPDVAPPNEVNTGPAQADLVCYGHGRATYSWGRLGL